MTYAAPLLPGPSTVLSFALDNLEDVVDAEWDSTRLIDGLAELLRAEAVTVLTGLGLTGVDRDEAEDAPVGRGLQVAGMIGIKGEGVRGSVSVVASRATFLAVGGARPATHSELAWALDVAGELANMMAGRLRTAAVCRGVDLAQSLPLAAAAADLARGIPSTAATDWTWFHTSEGTVRVRLDLDAAPGVALLPPAAASDEVHADAFVLL